MKNPEKAEEQLRIALEKEPTDISCNLALAALMLRRNDADALKRAERQLDKTWSLMSGNEPVPLQIDYHVTRAVYYALKDDPEKAKIFLKNVFEFDAGNEYAMKIRSLIDR
jgi:hypothetical protein